MRHSTFIVTALPEELSPVRSRLREAASERIHGIRVWRGRLGSANVALACTGDGNRAAEAGTAAVLEGVQSEILIGAGVAGALTPGLAVGQIVYGERILDGSGALAGPEAAWAARARRAGAEPALLRTVDRILCQPEERAALARAAGTSTPAAVDLESASWARAAARSGVSFLALRAISDGAEEPLPGILARCQEPGGPIRRVCVLRGMVSRPGDVKDLLALRRRVREGSFRLAECLATILNYD
jgi:adenosylhomocysteine nucleosidase